MIDIKDALYNILHSRYGRDVRQSIHDGIYQINENANEAVQTAKAMGVGTDISSPTSPSTGYVAGNLYLNNSTWDLWQCIGTDSWVNKGNIKGETGLKGADGINYYIHIRYSDKYDGTGFTASPTASSEYMGVYYGTSQTAPTNKQDYQWTSYVGASGTSAYVHIMYSENADGTGFVSIPTPLCKYIGFYSGPLSSPPANKSYYTWSEYVGKSGTGSGDMTAAEYAPSGVYGKVDNAIKADKVGNADTPLLEKLSDVSGQLNYDGNPVGSDYINSVSNEFNVNNKKLSLANSIITKLAKLNSDGTLNFSNVTSRPTTLSGYGITDAYTKTQVDNKLDSWFSQTKQATATGEQSVVFTGLDTTKAYELWFETTDGSQVGIKSSSLSGTTMTYVVDIPSTCPVPVNFKLRVIK